MTLHESPESVVQTDEALASTPIPAALEPPQAVDPASEPTQVIGSVADELARLAALLDLGVLPEDEFTAQKAKLLAG